MYVRNLLELDFGIFKTVGHKVNRLEGCDGIVLNTCLLWLEGSNLGLVAETVLRNKKAK